MNRILLTGAAVLMLANAGLPANAAAAHKTTKVAAHAHAAVHVASRPRLPYGQPNVDIGQFIQSMLGGRLPAQYSSLIQNALKASASHRSSGSSSSSDWSPTYDNSSSPTIDESSAASQAQAASDAENQAIQSMNDTNAMNASMAAAEEQNDAANAAALQTELNANN